MTDTPNTSRTGEPATRLAAPLPVPAVPVTSAQRIRASDRARADVMLTTLQVAQQLGVDPSTVRRWVADGRLVAMQPGRSYRVRQGDVDELLRLSRTSQPLTA